MPLCCSIFGILENLGFWKWTNNQQKMSNYEITQKIEFVIHLHTYGIWFTVSNDHSIFFGKEAHRVYSASSFHTHFWCFYLALIAPLILYKMYKSHAVFHFMEQRFDWLLTPFTWLEKELQYISCSNEIDQNDLFTI